jgi:hypothetical protein
MISFQKTILLTGLFCTLTLLAFSQASPSLVPVRGIVTDSLSGKGLSYVTLLVLNRERVLKKSITDASGKFKIALNAAEEVDFIFQSVGYRTLKRTLNLSQQGNEIDMGVIPLGASNKEIGEVTVSALKPLIRSESDKLIYSVEADPESKTGSVLELLRKIPLVSLDGEDKVYLMGKPGVKFLLNGKNSSMLDRNAREVLRNMPAQTVKDIEVITNPSSKYEAEGASGMINIITRRKMPDGYSGRVNAGMNTLKGYNSNFYFASKADKFIYSVNVSQTHWANENSFLEMSRVNMLSATDRFVRKKWYGDVFSDWNQVNSEASYEADSMNLISFSLNGNMGKSQNKGHTSVSNYDQSDTQTSGFQNWFNSGSGFNSYTGNLDYQRMFKKQGRMFTLSGRYDHSPGERFSDNEVLGIMNYPGYHQIISSDMVNNEATIQVDYTDRIRNKNQMEAGFKQIWRGSFSNSDFLRYDGAVQTWVRDLSRINDLNYRQSVLGIYITYSLKLGKADMKAGLRAENTVNNGFFKSARDTGFTNRMFNLVPYFLVSGNGEKGRAAKFSYTQRLSRPGIWYLNPFRNDADPQNISMGNPQLETEITHSFDFSRSRFTKKYNFSLNLNGTFSNNLINDISGISENGVRFTTFDNIGKDRRFGAGFYGSSQVTGKLKTTINLGLNYRKISSNNGTGYYNAGWTHNGSLNLYYNLKENTNLLAGAGGNSGYIGYQSRSFSNYWYYFTLQQDLFSKKLRIETRIDYPFAKYIPYTFEQSGEGFHDRTVSRNPGRNFSFRMYYSFGKMKDQVKKTQKSIRNDDMKQGGN